MIGTKILFSPVGEGTLTDYTERGYPRVNHVAVTWLIDENYQVIDPIFFLQKGRYHLIVCSDPEVKNKLSFGSTIVAKDQEEADKIMKVSCSHPYKFEVIN